MSLTKQFCTLEVHARNKFHNQPQNLQLKFLLLEQQHLHKAKPHKKTYQVQVYFTQGTTAIFPLTKTLKRATRTNMHIFIPACVTAVTFKGSQASGAIECRDGSQN